MRFPRLVHFPRNLRSIHTNIQPLNLYSKSPLIRPHNPPLSSDIRSSIAKPDDFLFWPNFFNVEESKILLSMALWKLDRVDSTLKRRKKGKSSSISQNPVRVDELQSLFDREYGFEDGHYDSVIHNYRETLLSSLPTSSSSNLKSTLAKLYSLLPNLPPFDQQNIPPEGTITHLLHLSPKGEILPHVDNLEASGSVICGVSLGAERTLRLKMKDEEADGWDIKLTNGSVYLQRDSIRYNYEHSILPYSSAGSIWNDERLKEGHRISIMIRDTPSKPAEL
ncbi:uncharacterized protein I206_102330 [Kwoniella pini CBS 10737]|uniref:Alpha-ketoglutarate-dependent dioxygenase AlkB-like domain-containing protein n=1 Tax=Kwoniella pini CBS 10737 TaxID=1296096 RepID=A0A1B9HT68_9TREE|nr:uncharacterized protein I206_07700 [Kwoniella pini CBS 10737]OCF46465.1 hypothetical protein I206_07700 [Kwoniella pini CBS 10737]